MAEVKAVCISERKGTMKHEVPEIRVKICLLYTSLGENWKK